MASAGPGSPICIIADDLTGALDATAPFAARRLPSCVFVHRARPFAGLPTDTRVVAANTESRYAEAEQAARAVAEAVRELRPPRDALAFKKIDSTLRGQVSAEVLAMARALGRRAIVISPAFPAQGRVVRQGQVLVHGAPLAATAYAGDAAAPPADLAADLAARTSDLPVHRNVLAKQLPQEIEAGIWLCDCTEDAELRLIADWVGARRDAVLAVGSAGLAHALARAWGEPGIEIGAGQAGPALVLVGSRAPEAARQAADLLRSGLPSQHLVAPDGRIDVPSAISRCGSARIVLLQAAAGDGQRAAADVAADLAEAAARLIDALDIGNIIATGGDTARALLDTLEVTELEPLGEVITGLPVCRINYRGRSLAFVTKAGGFGQDDVFTTALMRLGLASAQGQQLNGRS